MRCMYTLILPMALLATMPAAAAPADVDFSNPALNAAPEQADTLPAGLADRDGDGLSDSLQARLDAAGAGDRLDVVVTFSGPGRAAEMAARAVGPFQASREFRIVNGFAASMTAAQISALGRSRGIHRIEEDFTVTANLDGATVDFGSDAAIGDFLVDGSGASMGRRVGVCIIDTGIHVQHEQLDNGKVAGFFDAINGQANPYDDHGHGTHVASITGGDGLGGVNASTYQGVAPGVALYGAKVLSSTGSGSASGVLAGIEWCADQAGVDILSMSLGTAQSSDGQDALSVAVNCVSDPNFSGACGTTANGPKIVAVAAGNAGPGPMTVGSPGAAEKAITVGAAANQSGDGRGVYLSAFSSRGPTLDGRVKPDISAPGVRVTAANAAAVPAGYVSFSGTSMATPFVSGVVALMLDANPDLGSPDAATGQLPVDQVKDIMAATARDRGPNGPGGAAKDNEYGLGLLDAYAAVARASGLAAGQYQPTGFPGYLRTVASVADGGSWLSPAFDVAGDGTPIAATALIEGSASCVFGNPFYCDFFGFGWEWNPDLDMELIDAATGASVPANSGDITRSECSFAGEFCGVGRQETIYYTLPGPGSYRLRVYSFSGAGTFAVEVSGVDLGL